MNEKLPYDWSYKMRKNTEIFYRIASQLGHDVAELSKSLIPGNGTLVFFQSYVVMNTCKNIWLSENINFGRPIRFE